MQNFLSVNQVQSGFSFGIEGKQLKMGTRILSTSPIALKTGLLLPIGLWRATLRSADRRNVNPSKIRNYGQPGRKLGLPDLAEVTGGNGLQGLTRSIY